MSTYFRPRLLAIAALTSVVAACSEHSTSPLSISDALMSTTSSRPAPGLMNDEHSSHFTDASLSGALGNAIIGAQFLATTEEHGNHYQAAVSTDAQAGFPLSEVAGDGYLIVSSGDSRYVTTAGSPGLASSTNPTACSDPAAPMSTLCDVGGLVVPVNLPPSARALEVDFRYFSWDIAPFDDAFKVYLITPAGAEVLLATATTSSEFAGAFKVGGELTWGNTVRRVSVDVSAYAGSQVKLKFEASDSKDGAYDSGALIDNLRVLGPDQTAPVVSSVLANPAPAPIQTDILLTALVSDPSTFDAQSTGVQLSEFQVDGGSWQSLANSGSFTPQSTTMEYVIPGTSSWLQSAGVHTICVRASDAAGNVSALTSDSCIELAVYDPSAGSVSGSGHFESPAGALKWNPEATGRANFGFSAKYSAGKNTPDGRTRFTFRAGSLDFESTTYEWLVVSGHRAQFRGTGSVNGTPGYTFVIWGIDNDIVGQKGMDTFRIRITDPSGGVVYDNESALSTTADPNTRVQGGGVKISTR